MSSSHSTLQYKLIYLPFRGRAELIRFLFAHLRIPYEDERISREEWDTNIKPGSPFGILPILEANGKQLTGSTGIARMIAEQNGLSGSNMEENTEIFSIVSAAEDAWCFVYQALYREKDEHRKIVLIKHLHEEYLPEHIARFEKRAATNNVPGGWIWGNKLTYADFATYLLFQYTCENIDGAKEKYPTLAKLHESVEAMPNIAQWLKERPITWI